MNILNHRSSSPFQAQLTPESKVGDIVAMNPATSRMFEQLGIDYCCAGRLTLSQAASARALNVDRVTEMLGNAVRPSLDVEPDWKNRPMTELADHIESAHHAMLRVELPRLRHLIRKVVQAHGQTHPELASVEGVFHDFEQELADHMLKEEHVLFPAIRRLEQPGAERPRLDAPIACLMDEHEHAGRALHTMRQLTNGYCPPDGACATYRVMLEGLEAIERDMHRHVHKENSILFPRAAAHHAESDA